MHRLVAFVLLWWLCISLAAADERSYPEHGRVISTRTGRVSEFVPTYTDPLGKMRGGRAVSKETQIYRVETATRIYEFTEVGKRANYSRGDEIDFRVDTDKAFLRNGKRERKMDITHMEQKPKVP